MNGAAPGGNHRNIRIENGQPLGPTLLDQRFSRSRDQHALIAEGNDVGAHVHGVTVGNLHDADLLALQPVHQARLYGLHAHHR